MTAADRIITWTTAGAVVGVTAVASYEHAYALVRAHGEAGWTGRLVPLTVDGLIYASSMVMLDSARREMQVPVLARWLLGLGIAATLAANVAHGLGHGLAGAAVAAWSAVALVGSYELLMMVIRNSQAAPDATSDRAGVPDPLEQQAAAIFAGHLAADRVLQSGRSALSFTSASPGRSGCTTGGPAGKASSQQPRLEWPGHVLFSASKPAFRDGKRGSAELCDLWAVPMLGLIFKYAAAILTFVKELAIIIEKLF
jgi:Protein of unknown function (DUF2637)